MSSLFFDRLITLAGSLDAMRYNMLLSHIYFHLQVFTPTIESFIGFFGLFSKHFGNPSDF